MQFVCYAFFTLICCINYPQAPENSHLLESSYGELDQDNTESSKESSFYFLVVHIMITFFIIVFLLVLVFMLGFLVDYLYIFAAIFGFISAITGVLQFIPQVCVFN
jgi:hypothetical protein